MLVAKINAVKVESVPLNFSFFSRRRLDNGQRCTLPSSQHPLPATCTPTSQSCASWWDGTIGSATSFPATWPIWPEPPARTSSAARRCSRSARRTDTVVRRRRGGHAALPRRCHPRSAPGACGARCRSARHRAVRHRWHGGTRRRRALGCARRPGLAEHCCLGRLSRRHGRGAGADAQQPRLPHIPDGLRRPAGADAHVADL